MHNKNDFLNINSIPELKNEVLNLFCVIGKNGGRHYVYDLSQANKDSEYLTFNEVFKKFTSLTSNYVPNSDSSDLKILKERIVQLNIRGEEALAQASKWQKFATFFKRIGNFFRYFFSSREQQLNGVIQQYTAKEERFFSEINDILFKVTSLELKEGKIAEEIERLTQLKEELHQKVDRILCPEVYERLREKIENPDLGPLEIARLMAMPEEQRNQEVEIYNRLNDYLPIPQYLEKKEALQLLSRTGNVSLEPNPLSVEQVEKMLHAWQQHLPEQEETLSTFVQALKGEASILDVENSLACFISDDQKKVVFTTPGTEAGMVEVCEIAITRKKGEDLERTQCSLEDLHYILNTAPEIESEGEKPLTSQRMVNRVMRALIGDAYGVEKLMLQSQLLQDIRETHTEWAHDPDIRAWVKDTMVHLERKREQRLSKGGNEIQLAEIFTRIEEAYQEVITIEGEVPHFTITDRNALNLASSATDVLQLNPELNIASGQEGGAIEKGERKLLGKVTFKNPELALQQTTEWTDYVKSLVENAQFEAADRAAMAYLKQIKNRKAINTFLRAVPAQDIEIWTEHLKVLSETLLSATFALERPCVPHTRLVALLRTFELMEDLIDTDPVTYQFKDTHFYTIHLSQYFKKTDLLLGTSGIEVSSILQRLWSKHNKKNHIFFLHAHRTEEYDNRFNGAPPEVFLNTQHVFQLLHLALRPETINGFEDSLAPLFHGEHQKGITFVQRPNDILGENICIRPYDRTFEPEKMCMFFVRNYRTTTHKPPMGFTYQGRPIQSREVRKRLIHGIVVDNDSEEELKFEVNEHGSKTYFYYGDIHHFYYGMHTTQQVIQNEQLEPGTFGNASPSLCKKLQLRQTAPLDRIQNTLHSFNNNSELFHDLDMQRLFELNLFRGDYLYKKIERDEKFSQEITYYLQKFSQQAREGKLPLPFITKALSRVCAIAKNTKMDSRYQNTLLKERDLLLEQLEVHLQEREKRSLKAIDTYSLEYQENCREWLLAISEIPLKELTEEQIIGFAKRALLFTRFPRIHYYEDAYAQIFDRYDALLPTLIDRMGSAEIFQEVLSLRNSNIHAEEWEVVPDSSGLIWTNGVQDFYLENGEILFSSEALFSIPTNVKTTLDTLISSENKRRQFPFSLHTIDHERYYRVELPITMNGEELLSEVFIHTTSGEFTVSVTLDGTPFQLQHSPFSFKGKETLPRSLQGLYCFSNTDSHTLRFFDSQGVIRAEGRWTPGSSEIATLEKINGEERFPLLFPKDLEEVETFARLDKVNGLTFCESEGKIRTVAYENLGITYNWDESLHRWCSSEHPNYALSNKDLSSFFQPLAKKEGTLPLPSRLFRRDFKEYHLLESNKESEPPLLLLSGREYVKVESPFQKHTEEVVSRSPVASDPPLLFTYKVDPERGLCATSSEGYLYLSYLLYTQGKYPQAALAMRQGFNRMQGLSPQALEILTYFKRWKNDEPNGDAMRAQAAIYTWEQRQMEQIDGAQAIADEKEYLEFGLDLYKAYLQSKNLVDPQLKLTTAMEEKFQFLARRSRSWINKELKEKVEDIEGAVQFFSQENILQALEQGSSEEIEAAIGDALFIEWSAILSTCFIDFKDLGFYVRHELLTCQDIKEEELMKKEPILLKWGLDREIEARLDPNVLPPPSPPKEMGKISTEAGTPLLAIDLDAYLQQETVNPAARDKVIRYRNELIQCFKEKEGTYEAELARHICEDLEAYCASIGLPLNEESADTRTVYTGIRRNADLRTLQQNVTTKKEELQETLQGTKSAIIEHFNLGEREDALLRELKEQNPVVMDVFREGRWCFGSGEWSSFIDRGIIHEDSIEELSDLYKQYLLCNTTLKHLNKVEKELITIDTDRGQREEAKQRLATLLQVKRYYPEEYPMTPSLLLIEDELETICRKNQVEHFSDMINHQDAFKHEAWAGGKTYILRHLITRFHADGSYASGLLTHAPLIEEHHKSLKETTASVYGQQAYRTHFDRSTPCDAIAMRREYLKLIKVVQEKGRTDQTLNSLISRRHAFNHKLLGLNKDSSDELMDEISVFSDYLNFQQERLILGSDEMDELFTTDRQHNYASGAPVQLPKDVLLPIIAVWRLMKTEPYAEYTKFFQEPLHPREMSREQRATFLELLKNDICIQYGLEGFKEDLLTYWSPTTNENYDAQMEIHERIAQEEKAAYVQSLRIFFNDIFSLSYETKRGVDWGRSSDGVHTKPYIASGQCSEKSQHASIHLMAWYSCLDLERGGIETDSTIPAIESYKAQLEENVNQEEVKEGKTETNQQVEKLFGMTLEELLQLNDEEVAERINAKVEAKIHFAEEANFTNQTHYSKRLTGNGKQAAHECAGLSGSSGNNGRRHTLPQRVRSGFDKHPHMSHQKGTLGRIFYNLIKDYEEGDVRVVGKEDISSFLTDSLNTNSAFIDLGPFFEGLKTKECLQKIHDAGGTTPIRYVNEKGEIVVRYPDGKEIAGSDAVPKMACQTFFSESDCRGRNLLLDDQSSHWISLSFNTTLTDFSQAGMRARKWGEGQSLGYIVDRAGAQEMKGMFNPTGIMRLLITNEARTTEKLHVMSTDQEIAAVSDAAVQKMLRVPGADKHSLIALKGYCTQLGFIEQNAEIHFEQMSRPRLLNPTYEEYLSILEREQEKLRFLQQQILGDSTIAREVQQACSQHIEVALSELNETLLLDPVYYPEFKPSSQQTVETLELETEQQMEMTIAHEIEEETRVEQKYFQQEKLDIERDITEPREFGDFPLLPTKIENDYNGGGLPASNFILYELGNEKIYIANEAEIATREGYTLWCETVPEFPQLLGPSILIKTNNRKVIDACMGGVKDADCSFEFKGRSFDDAHYKFSDERPPSLALAPLKLPKDLLRLAIRKIAFGKFLYAADIKMSPEERAALKEIISDWDPGLYWELKGKVTEYLERHFPKNERQLLAILESIEQELF